MKKSALTALERRTKREKNIKGAELQPGKLNLAIKIVAKS